MKKYTVKFTHLDGREEIVEFVTDKIGKLIQEYCRTRPILEHEVLNENNRPPVQMLFG